MSQGQRIKFYGTLFSIITGYGAANPIATGISNTNPAVVTDPAHGFVAGDVVVITGCVGMLEVNNGLYVVGAVTANTYELTGVDALNYGVYTSGGSAAKATFSQSCEVTGYTGDSGTTTDRKRNQLRQSHRLRQPGSRLGQHQLQPCPLELPDRAGDRPQGCQHHLPQNRAGQCQRHHV